MFDKALSLAIRLACVAVILGWVLSFFGALTSRGYLLADIPAVLIVLISSCRRGASLQPSALKRLLRPWRQSRLLPWIYLLVFGLIVLGSVWHEPNNFDGLNYRAPKVLYWLDQHRWHWIKTPSEVVNYSLPNYEWLTVPLYLLTGGFHSTVIINWIAFLFLPSLFFTLLRAFGAPRRLAYDWMWILPCGYLIALQAGGIGNDLLGMTAILAAVHCANRFTATGRASYLFDALLAASFCTGIKLSNLPLPIFVLIILLKEVRLLSKHRVTLAMGIVLGLFVSALIPLLLNFAHTGTFLGTTQNFDQIDNPIAGLIANILITLVAAFAPPILPGARQIGALLEHGLSNNLISWLQSHYTKFNLRLSELPQEESGALGLGITLLLLLSVALWLKTRDRAAPRPQLLPWQRRAWWGWLGFAMLILFAKLGTGNAFPRNLLPWFPLMLAPAIAVFGNESIPRSPLWRALAPLAALSVVPVILLTPSRPLIPPRILLKVAHKTDVSIVSLERLATVYGVYAQRADPFIEIREDLPPDVQILGLISDGGEPTAAWWIPYGSHRCVYLFSDDDIAAAQRDGMQYIVVQDPGAQRYFNEDTAGWLSTHHAQPLKTMAVKLFVGQPAIRYTLVKLEPPAGSP